MFHFNTATRTTYYDHDVHSAGLDHCFDCMSEIFILGLYIEKFGSVGQKADIPSAIAAMSLELSKAISTTGRTLVVA